MPPKYKVLDSHVHLCSLDHIHYLGLEKSHMLYKQHRLDEYLEYNTSDRYDKQGIVVIEMNVNSSVDENGWQNPIEEYLYHAKLVDGSFSSTESSLSQPGNFIKGLIPWAPMPAGAAKLEKYISSLKQQSSSIAFERIKGFRYVVQDKPPKTFSDAKFIDSLKYLNSKNYVFDVGIDLQDGGFYQFAESLEVFKQFPSMKFIVNHLTKPDFYLNRPNEEFNEWEYYMTEISKIGNSYMKLSGCFEELPPNFVQENNVRDLAKKIKQWFEVVLRLYGTKRIIFGSNWPMDCTNGDHFDPDAFNIWAEVVELLLDDFHVDEDARMDIFYNNCVTAYNLTS